MPSSVVSNLSLIFGLRGESYGISAACATSALAVTIGARLVQSGLYDIVIAGGAECLDWVQALGFCACRALSHKYNDEQVLGRIHICRAGRMISRRPLR